MTNLRRAADAVLRHSQGTTLEAFVADRRARGTPWEVISKELYATTEGSVSVTERTLRRWFEQEGAAA